MNFQHLLFWMISFGAFAWVLIRALKSGYFPPDNDDDGGLPREQNLPVYDPPSGRSLDDLLVDRLPKEFSDSSVPAHPEKSRSERR